MTCKFILRTDMQFTGANAATKDRPGTLLASFAAPLGIGLALVSIFGEDEVPARLAELKQKVAFATEANVFRLTAKEAAQIARNHGPKKGRMH